MTQINELNLNLHKIDPDKSNYISFHKYYVLSDIISDMVEMKLRRYLNDSLKNHALSIYIMQGPEHMYTGTRFVRWLKKKFFRINPAEILRIVLDDKYCVDIGMEVITGDSTLEQINDLITPMIRGLVKKLEEHNKEIEDKVFDTWLDQYEIQPKVNWIEDWAEEEIEYWWSKTHYSDGNTYPYVTVDFEHNYHYNDVPTIGPFHGCSQEEIERNNKILNKF